MTQLVPTHNLVPSAQLVPGTVVVPTPDPEPEPEQGLYTNPEKVREILRGSDEDEDGGTAAELRDEQIQLEILNAQSQIDDALRGSYKVPFTAPVPQMIISLNTDIAAYLCDLNYRKSREYESDNYPIVRRYNRAREILEFYRQGLWQLPVDRADDIDSSGALVIHSYDGPLFGAYDAFGPLERDW